MNTQDFLFAIRNSYKSLRPSEQKVADFILQGAADLTEMNIQQMSSAAGVSQPTIIRFASAMGLKGFRKLRKKLIETYAVDKNKFSVEEVLDYPLSREDRLIDIPAKVIMTNIQHLEQAQKALSSYEYIQAVKALERAKNISVYAVENSSSFVFPV